MNLILQGLNADVATIRPHRRHWPTRNASLLSQQRAALRRRRCYPDAVKQRSRQRLPGGAKLDCDLHRARPQADRFQAGGDGHGFDPDHHRVHRRDRRHAGAEAAGRGNHRSGNARRTRISREPDAPCRAAQRAGCRARCSACTTSGCAFRPARRRMLAAVKAAGLKTLLVSGGFTFFTDRLKERLGLDYTQCQRAGNRRRQTDRPRRRRHRRRRGEEAHRRARVRRAGRRCPRRRS